MILQMKQVEAVSEIDRRLSVTKRIDNTINIDYNSKIKNCFEDAEKLS